MKLSIRGILLLGSVLLLPVVLILNFFVYQKSQEETYIQAIEKKVHAVEIAFNQDFELFQRQGGNPDSLSFARVSGGSFSYPFFIFCFVSFIEMSQTGCANMIPPSGGVRDTIPPRLITAIPRDSSKNITINKIVDRYLNFI